MNSRLPGETSNHVTKREGIGQTLDPSATELRNRVPAAKRGKEPLRAFELLGIIGPVKRSSSHHSRQPSTERCKSGSPLIGVRQSEGGNRAILLTVIAGFGLRRRERKRVLAEKKIGRVIFLFFLILIGIVSIFVCA